MPANGDFDPRRWRALLVLLLGQFCALLDVSVTNVALPSIGRATGAAPSELQWIVTGYVLAFGLMPVIGGRLGDALGRRRLFVIGLAGFVVASAAVGLAPTPILLIVGRVIQGLFGGVLGPQVSGYIQNAFPRAERGRAFGRLGLTVGVATALGPVVGGLLIGLGGPDFGWRLVFFINVPLGLIAIVLAMRWVAKLAPTSSFGSAKLDVAGALLLGLTILCLLFPTVEFNTFHNGWLFLLLVPGVLFLVAFLRRETRLTAAGLSPLLDLRLFRIPTFATGASFIIVFFCCNTGLPLVLSLYYQQGLGFTALESGIGVSALAIGSAAGAIVAGRLVQRFGRPLVVFGVSLFFVGTLTISLVVHAAPGLTSPADVILRLVLPLFVVGFGGGCVISPNQTLSLVDVDPRMGGAAGGVLQTGQRVGSAIGQTVLGTLFFATLGGAAASAALGVPAAHPQSFAGALDAGIIGSLVFSAAAIAVGVVDVVKTRRLSAGSTDVA